jgi:hypothetical protein
MCVTTPTAKDGRKEEEEHEFSILSLPSPPPPSSLRSIYTPIKKVSSFFFFLSFLEGEKYNQIKNKKDKI